MAQHQSAEEVEKAHLQALGPVLGPVYRALHDELIWLHAKWLEYRKLFAQTEARIDLLNASAAFFFRVIQDVLWDDILLHIARLTDPPELGSFKNLTLLCLPDLVPDRALADELRGLTQTAREYSKFARERRNKELAHNDLTLAIDATATQLPGVSRAQVEDTLRSFRETMNRLYSAYFNAEVGYEHFLTHEDANALVQHLAIAMQAEERKHQRFQQGAPLPEDLQPPPAV